MPNLVAGLTAALTALVPSPVRQQRALFVAALAPAIVQAGAEACCHGPWETVPECRPTWNGSEAELDAFVGTLAFWESGFVERIQAVGGCKGKECDGQIVISGVLVPRSTTVYQIQGLSLDRRSEVVGLGAESLFEASREAVRVVEGHRSLCRTGDWATCVFTGLAGTIVFRQAPLRTATYRKVLGQIRAE